MPRACISLFGGIQPGPLRGYLADSLRDGSSNDGLMQRLQLLVWPDIPEGWRYVDRAPNLAAIDGAAAIYRKLANVDPANPLRLRFAGEAQDLFEPWLTELEQRIRGHELPPFFQSHLAKYRSLMPSLALLFALADGCADEVPLSHARLASDCVTTWSPMREDCTHRQRGQSMMRRLLSASGWQTDGSARKDHSPCGMYRNDWSMLDTPETAKAALLMLADHGWVRREDADAGVGPGRKPSETFRINPRVGRKHVSN